MVISSIELTNFRNFEWRKLVFCNRNIFFTGKNGSGKSNLLESIAFSSLLRSFRGASPKEMIRLGTKEFQIKTVLQGKVGEETLHISESLSGKRRLEINHHPVSRSSDFIREFHCVVFSPEDRMLTGGSSGCRRKFFDILISTIEPEYLLRLSRYTRALMQRNRALKQNPKLAGEFNEELSLQAPFIAARRQNYTRELTAAVNILLNGENTVDIIYKTDTPGSPEAFLELLSSRSASEQRRCCTLTGVHLDEFEIIFNGKSLRTYGSTGQLRLISLLMKLAQFQMFRHQTPAPVAVLADDITGELDEHNLNLFLSTISHADQCFFTFASNIPEKLREAQCITL